MDTTRPDTAASAACACGHPVGSHWEVAEPDGPRVGCGFLGCPCEFVSAPAPAAVPCRAPGECVNGAADHPFVPLPYPGACRSPEAAPAEICRGRSDWRLGERNVNAKLTEAAVREIRQRYANGTVQTALAAEFGVTQSAISRIVRGKAWTAAARAEAQIANGVADLGAAVNLAALHDALDHAARAAFAAECGQDAVQTGEDVLAAMTAARAAYPDGGEGYRSMCAVLATIVASMGASLPVLDTEDDGAGTAES